MIGRPKSFWVAGAAAAVLATAAPSLAQLPTRAPPAGTPPVLSGPSPFDDPLSARDAKRMDRMEKVVRELRDIVYKAQKTNAPVMVQPADTESRIAEQAAKIADLELTLTRVNGSLETATHELDQAHRDSLALQAQVKALAAQLVALDKKVTDAAVPPPPPEPPPEAPQASAADALAKARQLMNSGDYDAAEAAFANIVATYPDNLRTPEANYWWGRTLAVRGDHVQAAGAFIASIRGWPQTPWAPEAVVELSRSLIALKKPVDACQTLAEFSRRYPKAPPAVASRAAAARVQAKCAA